MPENKLPIACGYILLSRKTLKSGIMEKPPLYLKMWAWMLLNAKFKDTKKLKRGQLFTNIQELRGAMSYKIGYRKECPTIKQIRVVYDFLRRGTMIDITKVTGGMVITILNYDIYQNPKNYEGHNEGPNDFPTRGTPSSKDKNVSKNDNKNLFVEDSNEFQLASYFFELIRQNNPKAKHPNLQTWSKEFDMILRVDSRDFKDVRKIIEWCQRDTFWQSNILSPKKLRQQFDRLSLRANGPSHELQEQYI